MAKALESVAASALPDSITWDVLAVDNNSNDQTREVIENFCHRYPGRVRYMFVPEPGKSHALNAALKETDAEVVAFTDDDVLFTHDYVRSIRTVFTSFPIDAAQGRVVLDCEAGWPKWLDETHASMADYRDFGQEVAPLKGTLCGTNMIVRKELFEQVGGFSPELGPGGIGVFEDTEISLRMRDRGYRLLYAPQILIRHQWARDRLTKAFIRKRMFLHGRVNAFYDDLPVSLGRFGLYVVKEGVLKELQALWHLWMDRPAMALHCQCEALEHAGFLYQHWLFRRGVRRTFSRGVLHRPLTRRRAVA